VQRQVLYLGEINDSQEVAWRKSIEVFDERKKQYEQLSLFPSDRPIPPDEVHALSVVLAELRLRRPRSFGDCWLGCVLWDELGLSRFWDAKLGSQRGKVSWRKVLQLLVINRLCEPGSEFAPEMVKKYVRFGSSPRGAQALILAGKVNALRDARFNVSFADIQQAALSSLRHRVLVNFEAEADSVVSDQIIEDILQNIATSAKVA